MQIGRIMAAWCKYEQYMATGDQMNRLLEQQRNKLRSLNYKCMAMKR